MSAEAWLPIKEKPLEEHKMKIVILGGVAGGMSAATRLRRLIESSIMKLATSPCSKIFVSH